MAVDVLEGARLAALRHYDIVDTPGDGTFDRITGLAARMLRVPIAIVSIVDEDRIWFRSRHGIDVTDVPKTPGLCASAILQTGPYLLPDARLDPVALTNPLVAGDFGLRFYAGVPLTMAEGHNLGTLCVIDKEPRTLNEEELATLNDLALLVVRELELRLAARTAVGFESEMRRNSEELSEALQGALLPPHLPRIPGLDVAAHYQPAARERIGGDFYDLFPLPRRGWGIAMGDVCGKGPRAATITAAARYALRAAAVEHDVPSDVLSVLNETLLIDDGHDDTRFCTLIYARLRPHGRDFNVTVGSGGHPLPLVLRDADGDVQPVGDHGTLVGSLPNPTFHDRTIRLRSGDTLLLYTDGVTEAEVEGRQLGREGLAAILAASRGLPAGAIVERVAAAVLVGRRQRDDVAVLALQANRH